MMIINAEVYQVGSDNFRHDQSMKSRPVQDLSGDNDWLVMKRAIQLSDDERGR